jgi:Flp pilus assembly protein TadG
MSFIRMAVARLQRKQGQTLVTFAVFAVALVLFLGLAIDLGFAYLTRASLSKAVDAAALTGARNLSLDAAKAAFFANYGQSGRDIAPPNPPLIGFSKDEHNNTLISVSASTVINTFFIRVLPQWKTLTVSASGQALRTKLLLMLVLDRSGSMKFNSGADALPDGVSAFIGNFDEQLDRDRAGLASFASNATTNNDPHSAYVPIERPFKTDIINAANRWTEPQFVIGRTFIDGGLMLATNAFKNVALVEGENVIRVVVLFTDGYANVFQDTFNCGTPRLLNLGTSHENPNPDDKFKSGYLTDPENDDPESSLQCFFANLDTMVPPCSSCSVATFTSIDPQQSNKSVNVFNVWNEGRIRALQTAKQMRTDQQRPITIYAIGYGAVDRVFLKTITNDKNTISGSEYDELQPSGIALFVNAGDDLKPVFQAIASDILLRLTR